jgi:hypothetical protein
MDSFSNRILAEVQLSGKSVDKQFPLFCPQYFKQENKHRDRDWKEGKRKGREGRRGGERKKIV